jgi:hypothetical protein
MVEVRTPATLGVASAVVYVLAMVVPYVAGGVPSGALQTYYTAFGIAGPPYVAVLALVALIVLAAGRQGRTRPDVAAGVALVLGFVVTLLTATWAFGGVADLVGSLSTATWLEYHRWVLMAAALSLFGSALWFADAIGVLRPRPEATS